MKTIKNLIGKKVKATLLITATVICGLTATAQDSIKTAPIHIGFSYPLSTNGIHAHEYANDVSLHCLIGVSKQENAFAAAGISNIILQNAHGIQGAGMVNYIGGLAKGGQFAGISNITLGRTTGGQFAGLYNQSKGFKGAQFSGMINLSIDSAIGGQFAGLVNVGVGEMTGTQAAGLINTNVGKFTGPQFAGIANCNTDSIKGPQFAGIANYAKNMNGAQIAGIANIALKDVKGAQVAGIANYADYVNGSQIAAIANRAGIVTGVQVSAILNIADSSDYPIGLLNIIKRGEKSLSLSVDETLTTLLSFRSGGRVTYGILGLGYNFKNDKETYAMEAGYGVHLVQKKHFRFNAEVVSLCLQDFNKTDEHYFKSTIRLMPTYRITKNIELFAAATFNFVNTNSNEGKDLVNYNIWNHSSGNTLNAIYVGYMGGIQFIW